MRSRSAEEWAEEGTEPGRAGGALVASAATRVCARPRTRRFRGLASRLCWLAPWLGSVLLADSVAARLPGVQTQTSELNVTESTGASHYRIPIEVPPGPGGLAPVLELVYSSRRGDGPYGIGWGLDLGEVACSARHGVPDYADCPRYELDHQLLVRAGSSHRYHPFVETFDRIDYRPASESWLRVRPNGTILRYGLTEDARVRVGPHVARWLLSEIEDPFGNKIFVRYDASIDPGTRYPLRITWGPEASGSDGRRRVDFVFGEDRPDPLHDYAGGIERRVRKRLTEIHVRSYGALVRRYVFGYSLETRGYTTSRSRLSWVQEFGRDCIGAYAHCQGLPRQEFEYSDPDDDGRTARFSKFAKDAAYVVPMAGNWHLGEPPVRIADVDGDGLPDLIRGGRFPNDALVPPSAEATLLHVELNTGAGFAPSPAWTAALRRLEVERPRVDFTQRLPRASTPRQNWFPNGGIFEATPGVVRRTLGEEAPPSPARPSVRVSRGARTSIEAGAPVPGWIEGIGRLVFEDLDADGLADLVISVELGGVDLVLDPAGDPIPPADVARVPGRAVRKVYRNTGDPSRGWVEDPALARGLPLFDLVQFESAFGVEERIPFDANTFDALPGPRPDPCHLRGLVGWERLGVGRNDWAEDVCIGLVNLDPRFVDLNGDGHLDLLVLELPDRELLYQGQPYGTGITPGLPPNHARSRAFLQVPDAAPGEPRWVAAHDFDLPEIPFADPAFGGHLPGSPPLAHSGPGVAVVTGFAGGGQTGGCPGFGGFPDRDDCAPLNFNRHHGVQLADLNRDGLADVIWSVYYSSYASRSYPGFPLVARGVLLNTGTGWCGSTPELAAHVQGHCPEAERFHPPENHFPNGPPAPHGLSAIGADPAWTQTGVLADLNADGWLDYVQLQTTPNLPGNRAWLFDPGGASLDPPRVWRRDDRFDLDIDYPLIFGEWADAVGFSVLDVDGDGAADVVGDDLRGGGVEHPQAFVSLSEPSDLLSRVRNGRGGELAIEYTSAIVQRDTAPGGLEDQARDHALEVGEGPGTAIADVVRWSSQPVVSAVRMAGPNLVPDPAAPIAGFGPATRYRYAQPRSCRKSRTDLGFRIVERVDPGGAVATSRFYQRHGRAGRLSRLEISDAGVLVHRHEEDWQTRPDVPATLPGSLDHPEVHAGRRVETRSSSFDAAGQPGALSTLRLEYDDVYGFDFVARRVETRPTGTLVTVRRPASDAAFSIFGLVAEEKKLAGPSGDLLDDGFLRHRELEYERGRVSRRVDRSKRIGDPGVGTSRGVRLEYDAYGNLTRRVVEGGAGERVTDFCFDGDHLAGPDAGWCPDTGQDSRSVRVGVRDAAGGIETWLPDAGTGRIVEQRSSYSDVPSRRRALDAFGRIVEEHVHDGQAWLRTARIHFDDDVSPSVVERWAYPDVGSDDSEAIWSATVSDGFGGVWKELSETPSGRVARLRHRDPSTRSDWTSLPVECVDALCSGRTGIDEPIARRVEKDALGRRRRVDTPDGSRVYAHRTVARSSGPHPDGAHFDATLEKDGSGRLTLRAWDGDRIAWVEECANRVDPARTELGGVVCSDAAGGAAPRTDYGYLATGELETVHDAGAASPWDDPAHRLRRAYDTLGRVIRIEDPSLGGARSTSTVYDEFGNVESVVNARGQIRRYEYDALDRPTRIRTPEGETDYEIRYRPGELQAGVDSSDDHVRTRRLDALGRTIREELAVRNAFGFFQRFHTDHVYDLLGRVTEVLYPAQHFAKGEWVDSRLRYEYEGAYLTRVCEPGQARSCADAKTSYVDDVGYDSLGRRTRVLLPGGERTFRYDGRLPRLDEERFVASGPGGYELLRSRHAYDGAGRLLSLAGSETASPALELPERFAYDARGRLETWTRGPVTRRYAFDELGNPTLLADRIQVYADPARPHAMTRGGTGAAAVDYAHDDDGNLVSRVGSDSASHFRYDSANRLVCIGASEASCGTRVAYDFAGRRVAEYPGRGLRYTAYVGETFVYEHLHSSARARLEVVADGERIALKRFQPRLRSASVGALDGVGPGPRLAGAVGGVLVLGLGAAGWIGRRPRPATFPARPGRCAVALGCAASLMLPRMVWAWSGPIAQPPSFAWELSDPRGTSRVWVDASGRRLRHLAARPFGAIEEDVGARFPSRYAGHRRHEASGLVFMGARWYDPEAGRFLSIDPVVRSLADPGSLNPYAYAENDPLGAVDPSGASVIFTYRQIDSEGNTAFEITLQAESTSDLGSLASSVAERGGQVSLDGVDITKQLVAPGAVSSPAPSVPPPAGGPSGSSKAPADSPHEPTSGSAGRDTAFVDSGVYPSDEGSSWAGEPYLVAELIGPRRTRIGEGGRFAGLGAAYASQLAVAEGGALAAAGIAGLEVVRNSLRAAAALASARAVLGLTVRQAVLAGAVAGPAVVIGVAAGLYVTGFAIENGIRLYNERTGSDWTTPNAILGRRLFPVIE